ncbi:MAG: efflux RND transporter periplasmic adaptor subunit [Planctomycetaceae bacterium]|nr:efflux RND transporter periplasmic adaptor subunit [Planctomycetaceae bacterium]
MTLITSGIIALFFLVGAAYYYLSEKIASHKISSDYETVYVRVTELKEADNEIVHSFSGVVRESQTANLSFRVPGLLTELNMAVGQHVQKNDVLAQLDSRDYELLVKRIEAEIEAANAMLSAMKTGARDEDIATLEAARNAAVSQAELAETNLKRFEKLLKEEVATQAQFDAIKTQYDTALAARKAAEKQLEKGKTGSRKEEIQTAEAKIGGLNVSLAEAKHKLSDTVLRAPYDGYIVEKFVENHEVIAAGVPVVTFAETRMIEVAANLSEDVVMHQNEILGYSCIFEAYPDKTFSATLKEMGRAVQRSKQTYPLTVYVETPPNEKAPVFPGMTAIVQLKMQRSKKPFIVPTAALLSHPENKTAIIWALDPQTEEVGSREVKVLRLTDDGAEIEGDLRYGEKIVTAGARFLSEKQKVKAIPDNI